VVVVEVRGTRVIVAPLDPSPTPLDTPPAQGDTP